MTDKISLVITSISSPNKVLIKLADGCVQHNYDFIVLGDIKSPSKFKLKGCGFYSINRQHKTGFKYAELCPEGHYVRKNIGYLLAIQKGANVIVETDDDNEPYDRFWDKPLLTYHAPTARKTGWLNCFRYFTSEKIWPRGFPLTKISDPLPSLDTFSFQTTKCPIQQGLSDGIPDLDSIGHRTVPLPLYFENNKNIVLKSGSWCPFNSQNTTWLKEAFPLMYLPACVSSRLTDIWRSFIAQRIAWANNWGILFHEPTMLHKRNKHNYDDDYAEERPMYLLNEKMCEELSSLPLKSGVNNLETNLLLCYERLIKTGIIDKMELDLLKTWLSDLKDIKT